MCLELEKRYQLKFLEIGTDEDHVHFLVQSVPSYCVTKLVTVIKSITASEVFRLCSHVKKRLWGSEFWSDGYFVSTVLVVMAMNTRSGAMSRDREESINNYTKIGNLLRSNFSQL